MMGLKKPTATTVLLVTLVLVCCCSLYVDAAGPTLVLASRIRDQGPDTMAHAKFARDNWVYNGWTNHPTLGSCGTANGGQGWPGTDFELPLWMYGTIRQMNAPGGVLYNGELGLVGWVCNATNNWNNCGMIGEDKTPVYQYPGRSPFGTVQSPTSYWNWWHDSQQTVSIPYNLTLKQIGTSRNYQYDGQFFPIDGRGFNDIGYADDGKTQHNYAFCMEIHGHFSYQGGETFSFTGDDDLWVYLGSKLVIDLGGIHTALSAEVKLDQIAGFVKGTNYRFDLFYCERHTSVSNLKLTTSIEIACTYYDWCDICEGNGQSCCTAADLLKCNDNNACTQDKCAVLVPPKTGCQNTDISASCPTNACFRGACDPKVGCTLTATVCNDNKKCTIDTCNNATGCVFTPIECKGDKCNTPYCDEATGTCKTTPVVCNDDDLCTTDSCNPAIGCQYIPRTCPLDACLTGSVCDSNTGRCVNTSKNCDDQDPCTADSCNPSTGCRNTQIPCGDDNKCRIWSCTKAQGGCKYTNRTCNDNDECTVDSCDPKSGCSYVTKTCDDGDACTVDSCNKQTGCQTVPRVCNDNSRCTNDTCDRIQGCLYKELPCDDGNACTKDECTPLGGCVSTPIVCNDNDACTNNTCNPASGCVYPPISCDDRSPCTKDTCDKTTGCKHEPQDCDRCLLDGVLKTCAPLNNNLCFPVDCDPRSGACNITKNITCNDNDLCTQDSCDSATGNCRYQAISCNDNNPCTEDACEASIGCTHTNKTCDDGNPCTTDSCGADGNCKFTLLPGFCIACDDAPCRWTDVCNPKICTVDGSCEVKQFNCDDNNACTKDTCDNKTATATCMHENKVCDNSDLCALQTCNVSTGMCIPDTANNLVCDDKNPCTTDKCVVVASKATCDYVAKTCTGSFCAPETCDEDTGNCVALMERAPNCDDSNECTIDACENLATTHNCTHVLRDCAGFDTGEACTPAVCDEKKGCVAGEWSCDDGNFCTDDACAGPMNCTHVDASYKLCDDDDSCTVDVCNASSPILAQACNHYNKTCVAPNVCQTVAGCNSTSVEGCVFANVECEPSPDFCMVPKCDEVAGCIRIPKVCIVDDPDCYVGICDSVAGQCISEERPDWTTTTTEKGGGVTCYAFYRQGETIGIITGGVVAGIVVGAVVFAAAAAVAARKAYLFMQLKQGNMGAAQSNPLYTPGSGDGMNPLYK